MYQGNEGKERLCGDRETLCRGRCLLGYMRNSFSLPIALVPQLCARETCLTQTLSIMEQQRVTAPEKADLNCQAVGALGGKYVYLQLLEL